MKPSQIAIFVVLAVLIVSAGVYFERRWNAPKPVEQNNQQQTETMDLKIEDLVVGTGAEAKAGDTVTVHYTGTLDDGTKFDSSYDHGKPFTFTIGGRVIDGWNQGIPGMKVGGKRRLIIPSGLGYGPAGSPPVIPPNATLHFDVELLDVQPRS